jgi:maleylacetoacetate isomerase
MRLFTRYQNSAGERVRIALHLKGLAYDYVPVGSLGVAWRDIDPQGPMPALEVAASVFAQSAAILEYLEETQPEPPLLPATPIPRAQARAFGQLIAADLHPLNNNRVRRYLAGPLGLAEPQIAAWYRHWLVEAFTALETTLRRRPHPWPFCLGETPGWADLHLVPQMRDVRRFGCDLAPYPLLAEIDARCLDLEAFRRAAPHAQPDAPNGQGRRSGKAL